MSSYPVATTVMLSQIKIRKKQYEASIGRKLSHYEEKIFIQGFTAGRVDTFKELADKGVLIKSLVD